MPMVVDSARQVQSAANLRTAGAVRTRFVVFRLGFNSQSFLRMRRVSASWCGAGIPHLRDSRLCHNAKPGMLSLSPVVFQTYAEIRTPVLTHDSFLLLNISTRLPRFQERYRPTRPTATQNRTRFRNNPRYNLRLARSRSTIRLPHAVDSFDSHSHAIVIQYRFRGTSDKTDRGRTRFAGH